MSAREEFARGEEARKANDLADAQTHYNAVLNNPRADAQTTQKAQQQLAAVTVAQKTDSSDGKSAYKQAVDEYRKGLWKQARADFDQRPAIGLQRRIPSGQPRGISPQDGSMANRNMSRRIKKRMAALHMSRAGRNIEPAI